MQTALALFRTAKERHEQGDTDEAMKGYAQAYRIVKELGAVVPGLLDYYGELCVSVGDYQLAKSLYTEAIRVEPGGSPQKYLSLAQLEGGKSAAKLYEIGIRMLETSQSDLGRASIAAAHAALAELYMTDLCDEAEAEEVCERHTAAAIEADPSCVDGYQSLANLRLIRGRLSDAKCALDEVLRLLRNLGESNTPSPQFVAETARMYVELEAWSEVREVTEIGIHISEQPDLLYLNAFSKFKLGEDCRDVLEVLREVLETDPSPEIAEAASELESRLDFAG